MKILISFLAVTLVTLNSFALNVGDFRIGSNGKSNTLEVRCTSKFKKNKSAVITITNAEGKVLKTQNSELICGDNKICLDGAIALPEGTYTVTMTSGKKTYSTKFMVWGS